FPPLTRFTFLPAPNSPLLPYTTLFRSLFYTVIGAHHFIFSPVPYWLQTTAILFSVGMMVPVWAGTGNFLHTLRGAWHGVRRSYRSEEHTSELQHLGISYAVFCLKKKRD